MHPADMIFFWARSNPEQPALIQSDTVVSYRELAEAVAAVFERLEQYQLGEQGPVGVSIPQPIRKLAVCFALLRHGISAAPIDRGALPFLRPNGINDVIYAGDNAQVLSGGKNIRFEDSWLRHDAHPAGVLARPNLTANADIIFFTSGTTGMPKKIVLPGGAVLDRNLIRLMSGGANCTRVLVMPGISSGFGFMRTSDLICAGKTVCFSGSPEVTLRMINLFEIEAIIASPQQILLLVEFIEKSAKYPLSSLKEIVISGGFLSPGLLRRVQARLCRNVISNYGSTEAGLIALANYDFIEDVPNAVGFPAPGVAVEIVDENGQAVPIGEEGRVRCRSSHFLKACLAEHPERTNDSENVWWYSGDIGRLTNEGILCILGRTDDLINCGGVKMSGALLDEAARNVPGIKDAGVCAVRGQSGIEEVWVGVVPDGEIKNAEIKERLAKQREFQNSRFEVFVLERMPRNDLGKLQRFQLKDLLLDQKRLLDAQVKKHRDTP